MRVKTTVLFFLSLLLVSGFGGANNCSSTSSTARIEESAVNSSQGTRGIDQRIERVENGLLLPVIIKGQPSVPMKLADRMQFFKTPGVSIAVINNGRIEWARAYGVREAGNNERVTTETLFQAGSISKAMTAVAALRLVQQGKLNLDEDVNQNSFRGKFPKTNLRESRK